MLRSRVIVSLLLLDDELVKTKRFKDSIYVGDPLNIIKIFNEKKVDEVCIFDISPNITKRGINYKLIEKISRCCRMPLCYGGGISNLEDAQRVISCGVEKVSISRLFFQSPAVVEDVCRTIGSQSLVVTMDVRSNLFGSYGVYVNNGRDRVPYSLVNCLDHFNDSGAGELLINNIDRDGTGTGYDYSLLDIVYFKVSTPMAFLGGGGHKDHILDLIQKYPLVGACAGSLFTFKGKYQAVLPSYFPSDDKFRISQKGTDS